MVDTARRSYIATPRGNQSLEYLLAVARAHLMKRARVVEITVAPKLERMPEVTLRKNCFVTEPRIGEALGKIIGYSIALDGSDGRINCEIKVGCTIGKGGTAVNDRRHADLCGGRLYRGGLSGVHRPPRGVRFIDYLRTADCRARMTTGLNFQFPLGRKTC